jgi:hypothetical protein
MLPTVVPLPVTAWVSDTCYNKPSSDKPMILSMSSDLQTRRIVWTGRNNDDTPMGSRLQPQLGVSAFAIAGQFAELWHDEAQEALPAW